MGSFAIILLLSMCYFVHSILKRQQQKILLIRTTVFVGVFVVTWSPFWWSQVTAMTPLYRSTISFLQITTLFDSTSGIFNFIVWLFFFPDLCNRFTIGYPRRRIEIEEDFKS